MIGLSTNRLRKNSLVSDFETIHPDFHSQMTLNSLTSLVFLKREKPQQKC